MYLAQKKINGKTHYFIRQSYRKQNTYFSRDLLELGTNPARYIVYPGGNSFYIDEVVTDQLESRGIRQADEQLEDIFWQFLKPEIKRALEDFRRREKRSKATRRPPASKSSNTIFHTFDKRRIHFLKFGQMDQRNISCLPAKFFRLLLHKSRDEIEQKFIEMEKVLRPSEYKAYTYVIFDLQRFFPKFLGKARPEILDPDEVDQKFLDAICALNGDRAFWAGAETSDRLHVYLVRYVWMHFDYDYASGSFMQDHIRDFINRHRVYTPPLKTAAAILGEASVIFGETKAKLNRMDRSNLARLYRRRAQKFHPDKGGDHEKFVRLTQSYHELLKRKK